MIEGIFEVCIGTADPLPQLQYWQQFGYRIGAIGSLSADQAKALYGVQAALHSIRLYHQQADHGLVRLMVWPSPKLGLGLCSMRLRGNRWATSLTENLLMVLNHAEEAQSAGSMIRFTQPYWEVIYQKEAQRQPFVDDLMGVREALLLQPLTRQVLFQRFGYTVPDYGAVHPSATFGTSQITHAGLVVQDDTKESLQFYEAVLGLLRSRDDVETTAEGSAAGRDFFDLSPGEKFWVTAFDDPRSSTTQFQAARSGRLYIIRFPEAMPVEANYAASRPGCTGMSLYTYRVEGLMDYRDRIVHSPARAVTPIVPNEFGEQSFSFIAPDGYDWNLVERSTP